VAARFAAMVRDPACGLTIAGIARQSGFPDISPVNRCFGRAFGDRPLGLRVPSARATVRFRCQRAAGGRA
jgi:hypothetical protein